MSTPVYKKHYFAKDVLTTNATFVTAITINLSDDFPSEANAYVAGSVIDLWITDMFVDTGDLSAGGFHSVTKWHAMCYVPTGLAIFSPGTIVAASALSKKGTSGSDNGIRITDTTDEIFIAVQSGATLFNASGRHFLSVEASVYRYP